MARWLRSFAVRSADGKVDANFSTDNIELDELHGFACEKHPDEQECDLDEVGQHWTHIAMARESRLMLEVVVSPHTQEVDSAITPKITQGLPCMSHGENCMPVSFDLSPLFPRRSAKFILAFLAAVVAIMLVTFTARAWRDR